MSTSETDLGRTVENERRQYAEQRELDARDERDPEAIERRIDATRADMRATLDALERRWSMDRLMDLTIGRIRERGGAFAGNLTDAATQNPVPMLLTSVGLAWMMLTSRRGSRIEGATYEGRERGGKLRDGMDTLRERAGRAGERLHAAVDSARDSLRDAADSSRERFEQTSESLRGGAESMRGRAGAVRGSAREAAAATREQIDYARRRMERMLDEQPLMIGAFGLAAGAIIGALLPTTEHEDRLLGEIRDKAVKTVAEKSSARLDRAGDEGDEAAHAPPSGMNGAAAERPTSRPH